MVDVIGRAKVIVETDVDSAGVQTAGSKVGNILSTTLKGAALGAGAGMAAILGTALTKGFDRLTSIENAEAKLRGLGNSAKTVSQVMDDALASVKGTAFGLGDAASVAASAVASGIKPGQDLERTLKLVADAATIAGIPLNEMGAIFNKVAATGKIQGEVIAQLGERGIPIIQLLAEEMGVTAAEVVELASTGQINFAMFQDAMEQGLGGAALESGKTFEGALANAGAALGRFGAALLGPAFEDGPAVFEAITAKLDDMTPAAETVGQKIGELGQKISDFQKSKDWSSIKRDMGQLGSDMLTLAGAFGDLITQLDKLSKYATGKGILANFTKALIDLANQYAPIKKIADAIELISKAIDKVNGKNIKDFTDSGKGSGFFNSAPGKATGGPASGLTLVGERGPELVDLPNGSYVHSNINSERIVAGGGDTYVYSPQLFGYVSGSALLSQYDWESRFAARLGPVTV